MKADIPFLKPGQVLIIVLSEPDILARVRACEFWHTPYPPYPNPDLAADDPRQHVRGQFSYRPLGDALDYWEGRTFYRDHWPDGTERLVPFITGCVVTVKAFGPLPVRLGPPHFPGAGRSVPVRTNKREG